tara:strand:+ start:3829 stop:4326 length:498 start_codon:yes stop_codon:yes gene_type:complete
MNFSNRPMVEIENFISNKEANYFINFHKKNFNLNNHFCIKHRETEIIQCNLILNNTKIKKMNNLLNKFVKKINKKYEINYFQIVKWPIYGFQPKHVDFDIHPYTSILYLNDDFEGGKTIVEDKIVELKKCKLIAFNGDKIEHEVNKITKGIRYTIPCWYKLKSEI